MKLSIKSDVFQHFHPEFLLGTIICSQIDNKKNSADVYEMLRDVEEFIRLSFNPDNVKTHDLLSAWNAAVLHFGDSFKHYQSNTEKLMAEIIAGREIPDVNTLVDLCNFVSLKYIIPVGSIDLRKVTGSLTLSLAAGTETVLSGKKKIAVQKNDLILHDKSKVLASKLNYESDPSASVTNKSKDVLVFIEAVPPLNHQKLENIIEELAGLLRIFCKAKVNRFILSIKQPLTTLNL